jgi:hypothetical protein
MMNMSLPPLCTSALGTLILLVAAGVLPWAETTLLLGVIAVAHSLPFGLKHLGAERLVLARPTKPSVFPPQR